MGDYNRYICEYSKHLRDIVFEPESNIERKVLTKTFKEARESAQNAYIYGISLAQRNLSATNKLRLGLILNFSIFQFQILDEQDFAAFHFAKQTYEQVTMKLERLNT